MGQLYRNIGPAITRGGQPSIKRGEVFEPTPYELERLGYKLEKVDPDAPAPAAPPEPELEWPLRMSPERYLSLYDDGQHADLARAIIAKQEASDGKQYPDE